MVKSMRNLLFTPGPLTTSETVKRAMLRDAGSRDRAFIAVVRGIREKLLSIAGTAAGAYEAILMQGSGTFGIESVLSSCIPGTGRLLVAVNGAYGKRMADIAERLGIPVTRLDCPEYLPVNVSELERALAAEPGITHVGLIHCETSTGIVNPVEDLGAAARRFGVPTIVDAMSSFGAIELDLERANAAFLISSANKCLEGVPGFSFVLARSAELLVSEGIARSVTLDLLAQWRGLETDGQFRFTPPTHALLAFDQALREFDEEGGIAGRAARYAANREALHRGMSALGFREYLAPEHRSRIITSYLYPDARQFDFEAFYSALGKRGFTIYPGKVSRAACFRIGTIGRLFPEDFEALAAAIREVLTELGFEPGKLMREGNQ
jgi:2-aminoethylphosphonate-pyruvate transaminase